MFINIVDTKHDYIHQHQTARMAHCAQRERMAPADSPPHEAQPLTATTAQRPNQLEPGSVAFSVPQLRRKDNVK